jgi:hypothetical protein
MTPGLATTLDSPQCLSDLDTQFRDTGGGISDEALLSAPCREGLAVRVFLRFLPPQQDLPVEERIDWLNMPASRSGETTYATLGAVATADLPPWIEETVPRLLKLCALGRDWDSRGSAAPDLDQVRGIVRLLKNTAIEDLAKPEIVPACGGGIQLEWYMEDTELELEFRRDGSVEYLATDNQSGMDTEGSVWNIHHLRSLLARLADK